MAKRQHKIKIFLSIGKIPCFCQKNSKNPEKLIVFQGFYSGQHFYPLNMAEGEGFEPPEAFTSTVFKTAAIDRSAILPYRPPQKAAMFCCLRAYPRPFLSGAPFPEPVLRQRPFSSGAPLSEPVQAPFSTVCAEEEERQSACARVRADDIPDVVILDLMPREIGF